MKLRARLVVVATASFMFAGGFGISSAAYADQVSNSVVIGYSDYGCGKARAGTYNLTGTQRGQVNVTGYADSIPGCTEVVQSQPTGYLGSNAYLRTSGGICSSVATTYSTASTAYKSSMAYLYAPCVRPSQLAGGGTGYYYQGSGYASKAVLAPYQPFS